ncbi:MAG: ATP-dependent DNA helicase UvrD2 [Acidimicrobiales bacterium]
MARDRLDGLGEEQIEAVTTPAAPLAVIAGPGSGKTRVLTHRIAWRVAAGHADPAHVLVLTFSRRAASELFGRLRRLGLPAGSRDGGVTAGTFHAIAWAELARHHAERGRAPVSLLGRPARLLAPALARVVGREVTPAEVSWATREMTWARLQELTPEAYPAAADRRRPGPVPAHAVAETWAAYQRAKRDRRVLDLDDLLETCTHMLLTDAEMAQAARWRHRHVFVDEYQDLNPAHRRLLHAWVSGREDLCIVGDPDQAIYGFNGASPDLFDRIVADFPGIEIRRLTANHRSTPEVVAVAEAVRPGGAPMAGTSTRGPGPLPRVIQDADDQREAERVASEIARQGRTLSGMAVLARTNARLRLVGTALDRAGVPWRLRDPRPLADRPAIREWLRQLPAGAPARDLHELVDAANDPDGAALLDALADFEAATPAAAVSAFASWLDAAGVTADESSGPGVDLATFHRAKGLEWPAVWIVGVEEGLVPIGGPAAAVAEEQRLLYVAVTRARDELTVSWAARRTASDGATYEAQPSRWIAPLTAAVARLGAAPPPAEQQDRLAGLRRGLAPDAATTRRAALAVWRDRRARAARIPPAAVLSDRILDALATGDVHTAADVGRIAAAAGRRAQLWAPEVLRVLEAAR